jgi:hypothetical protein
MIRVKSSGESANIFVQQTTKINSQYCLDSKTPSQVKLDLILGAEAKRS